MRQSNEKNTVNSGINHEGGYYWLSDGITFGV